MMLSKHSQVVAFFDKDFVKTRIFPCEFSRSLHLGFDQRQVNDYGDIWTVNQEEAETIFSEASVFVDGISGYLNKQL